MKKLGMEVILNKNTTIEVVFYLALEIQGIDSEKSVNQVRCYVICQIAQF